MTSFIQNQQGDTANFFVKGDFVQSNTNGLRQALLDSIKNGITKIKIDLNEANCIDSPSIGLLVSVHNTLKPLAGELVVNRAKQPIAELFSVLQLDKRFTVNAS